MSKITTNDRRPARGRQRQAELAAAKKTAIKVNSSTMLAGLNRPHTLAERFAAEAICSMHWDASRLRDAGRSDFDVLMEAARLQQGSVFACLNPAARPLPAIELPTSSEG